MPAIQDRGRVLIADDEPAVGRFISAVLRAAGFEVDVVSRASEAILALSQRHYDALIADIKMPGNEQLELLESLRGGPAVPLVLMTAEPSFESALAAFRGGVLDYLVKPFTPEQLLGGVNAALEKARQSRAEAERQVSIAALIEAATQLASSVGHAAPAAGANAGAPPSSSDGPRLDEAVMSLLSPRQQEIARLLALGHPLPEVAEELELSAHTVRAHVKAIFAKLGVRSQVALLSRLAGRDPKTGAR